MYPSLLPVFTEISVVPPVASLLLVGDGVCSKGGGEVGRGFSHPGTQQGTSLHLPLLHVVPETELVGS